MEINEITQCNLIQNETLNICVYGAPGIGKTRFCSTAPKPFLIDIDNGSKSIGRKKMAEIGMESRKSFTASEVRDGIKYALDNKFKTICIDSLTRYSEILMDEVLMEDKKTKPQIQHWGEVGQRIKKMIWFLSTKEVNTIFTCHEKEVESSGGISKRLSLSANLSNSIPAILDAVGYMYITELGERKVSFNPSPTFYAKHRAPEGNEISTDLPLSFENLYQSIYGEQSNA